MKLFLLRNPWGNRRALREDSNGLFYMKVEDYLEAMDYTYINYDTTGWFQDYFMMWDDPARPNGRICGRSCTQHRLYVKSSVAQKVWVGAHTYTFYTYPDASGQCPVTNTDPQLKSAEVFTVNQVKNSNARENVIVNSRDNTKKTFTNGAGWLDVMDFEAGEEVEILVEFNWNRKGVTRDWSLTVWGVEGEVTVRHSQNLSSKHFAYTEKAQVAPKPEWEYTSKSYPWSPRASTTVNRSSSTSSWYNPDLTEARATDYTTNRQQSRTGYSTTPSTGFRSSFNSGVNRTSSFSNFISSINGIGSSTQANQSSAYPDRSSISNYGSSLSSNNSVNTRKSTYRPTKVRNYSWMN